MVSASHEPAQATRRPHPGDRSGDGSGDDGPNSDADFQFDQQTIVNHAPVALVKGDQIRATCTYDSDGIGKSFGDSSTSEMCFAIVFAYPSLSEPDPSNP